MNHLLIVTDAWEPQVNGVVRTLQNLARELRVLGVRVDFLTPADFHTVPCPTYPEISLALTLPAFVGRRIEAIGADFVHIATEGPIGWSARRWCLVHRRPFTTSYHTRFPEYLTERGLPGEWCYPMLRRFHNGGAGCMVSTDTLARELRGHGFQRLLHWGRGVDAGLFRPDAPAFDFGLPGPIFLSVGRVAPEKNLTDFLSLDLPGSKVVVGDGPARAALQARFPDVRFLGVLTGEALASVYASADVFVFPSRTDTFGIVLLEALACGLPVAAYPVMGPLDVIGNTGAGVLDEDLRLAALAALSIPRALCREVGLTHSWRASAEEFLANVEVVAGHTARAA